ncbi:MAG: phage major capsid protein [Candidatus Lokiarchaeota archaeon]|nr:phage major capsid protein [Candidatus Lokiarchaeota archaeon]
MGKKYILVDGVKKYIEEGEVKEETTQEEDMQKQVDSIAEQIEAKLNLKGLTEKLEKADKTIQKEATEKTKKLTTLDALSEKSIDKLSTREGLAVFFKAAINSDLVKLKALSEGVAADGGNLFPDEFRDELIQDVAELSIMRGLVRVITMTKDVMNIPTVTSKPKVYWTLENQAKTTTTADFGQETLTVYKMAAIIYASDELIEDSSEIDVVDLIISLFAEAVADEEDKAITAGTGTNQPTGLTAATIGSVACSGNLDFDDIINLEYLLPAKYSKNASFLVNRTNIREMRKIKDGSNRYLWMDSVAPAQPATFHGIPVRENNYIPESEIYYGDYKKGYWFGDRRKMTIKVSQDTETAFTKDQTAIRVVERIAGNVVFAGAIKKLNSIP